MIFFYLKNEIIDIQIKKIKKKKIIYNFFKFIKINYK